MIGAVRPWTRSPPPTQCTDDLNLGARVHSEGQFFMLFRVDEYLDVFSDSVLFVNDPEPKTGESVIQRKEQVG